MIVPFFISHQGCLHRCVFCDQRRITGEREGIPSPDDIRARIAAYRATSANQQLEVAFYGGSFTSLPRVLQEQLLVPLQPLRRSGTVTAVRMSIRPDAVDEAGAGFLHEMGVRTVELGVQSMEDHVLCRAGRGHTSADVVAAFRILRGQGLKVGAQLMPGLPGEAAAGALVSLGKVLALKPDCIRIYPALVLSGTGLAELYRNGEYTPPSLVESVGLCKQMLQTARHAEVPVLRMGLQPTEELSGHGAVLAGPFHPAFRQLVESALFLDLLVVLAREIPSGTPVEVACGPGRISDVVGQRRSNVQRLAQDKGIHILSVICDHQLSRDELEFRRDGRTLVRGNILDITHQTETDH